MPQHKIEKVQGYKKENYQRPATKFDGNSKILLYLQYELYASLRLFFVRDEK
jgi:hypothetical protein